MKKTLKMLKDPAIRFALIGIGLQVSGTYILAKAVHVNAYVEGGKSMVDVGEQMIPGFTEQIQKFISAKKYGWKS